MEDGMIIGMLFSVTTGDCEVEIMAIGNNSGEFC